MSILNAHDFTSSPTLLVLLCLTCPYNYRLNEIYEKKQPSHVIYRTPLTFEADGGSLTKLTKKRTAQGERISAQLSLIYG